MEDHTNIVIGSHQWEQLIIALNSMTVQIGQTASALENISSKLDEIENTLDNILNRI